MKHFPQSDGGVDDDLGVTHRVLETLRLVDAPPEEAFDKFTRMVANHLSVPVAIVSMVKEDLDRQNFTSQIGLKGK